jgi:hypothetical protein
MPGLQLELAPVFGAQQGGARGSCFPGAQHQRFAMLPQPLRSHAQRCHDAAEHLGAQAHRGGLLRHGGVIGRPDRRRYAVVRRMRVRQQQHRLAMLAQRSGHVDKSAQRIDLGCIQARLLGNEGAKAPEQGQMHRPAGSQRAQRRQRQVAAPESAHQRQGQEFFLLLGMGRLMQQRWLRRGAGAQARRGRWLLRYGAN